MEKWRVDERGDGRSIRFVGGLVEGTETVIAYVAFCLFPAHAALVAWLFTTAQERRRRSAARSRMTPATGRRPSARWTSAMAAFHTPSL